MKIRNAGVCFVTIIICAISAVGADWPQWGGADNRNMVSTETGLPSNFSPGSRNQDNTGVDMATTKNVKWVAKLGKETYGTPVVAGGRVYIGTNNGVPRNPGLTGDRSILMCFEETTGKFLWQLTVSKLLRTGNFNGDYADLGICSTPTVQGNRLYLVTTRCEALCLDVNGLLDGNDGQFHDEFEYISKSVRMKGGKQPTGASANKTTDDAIVPGTLAAAEADIIWRYDFMDELDVWPQDASDCSPLVYGDLVYVCPSNGVDLSHKNIPSPQAPSLIALDKFTGKLVAKDDANIGPRILHGEWSSPSLAKVGNQQMILYGGGDGFCYAFDPIPVSTPDRNIKTLRTLWRCDCNPKEYRWRNGALLPYNKNSEGPSEVIGTPVFYRNRVYVSIGQDTRHGPGPGALTCIDATKHGDISNTGVVWRYTELNRSFSTPSIVDGMVFVGDVRGIIHCLDADSGQCYWTHDTKGQMIGSTMVADGKVYTGNGSGKLTVLAASKEKKLLKEVRLGTAIHATPVVANGVLYVASQGFLYAVQEKSL